MRSETAGRLFDRLDTVENRLEIELQKRSKILDQFRLEIARLEGIIERNNCEIAAAFAAPPAPNIRCFTAKEVADAAGCSEKTIREHEKAGRLVARYPNARRRYHPQDVDCFLRGVSARKKSVRL